MRIVERALVVAVAGLFAHAASAAVIFQSTFDSGTEGWTAFENAPGNPAAPVSWAAGKGNPGGALQHVELTKNVTSFFLAPGALLSALAGAVGGSIAWDISTVKTVGDVFFSSEADIQVRGLGTDRIRLSLFSSAPEYPEYGSLDVGFTTAYGWNFFDGVTTSVATQAQIDDVLAHASSLIIRAEYWSGSLFDTAFLDNVYLSSRSVPEPDGLVLLGLMLAMFATLRRTQNR
jgi:hypothetical protein